MTIGQKHSIRKTQKYIINILLEENIRRISEEPNSLFDFMKKSERRKKFDDAGYILDHLKTVPSFLYKYRSCNENNFKALEDNSIWVSSAEQFIDPYDCRLPFSIKDLSTRKINKLMKWFIFAEYIYGYKKENLSRYEDALTPDEVRKIFFSHCYNNELRLNEKETQKFIKKHYPKEQWDKSANKFVLFDQWISRRGRGQKLRGWFINDCEEGCLSTIEMNRRSEFVCSLTESNDNPKMWEEYADHYKGFCIGYDFSKGIRVDLLDNASTVFALKGLLPVFYTEQRLKFDSYKFQLIQYKDTFYEIEDEYWSTALASKLYMQMLLKSPSYSNEQEWRIVVGGEEPGLIWFPFATTIYMGKDISKENKEKLMEIAIKNNFNVYQQKVGVEKFQYEIVQFAKPKDIIYSGTYFVSNRDLG